MEGTLKVLLGLVLVAVVGVLATGIVGFIKGGEFNQKYGNRLMRARVGCQAVAVFLILLLVLIRTTGQ